MRQLKDVIRLAIGSRILLVFIHTIFDTTFQDFDSSVENGSLSPGKWDAVYFNHIAVNLAYDYEQQLAFYPLFPFTVGLIARALFRLTNFSLLFLVQLTSLVINAMCFVTATYFLHRLTESVFGRRQAWLSCILFILNPANVFMTASYSESMFVCLQFALLYSLEKSRFAVAVILIGLSMLTRSNGILNVAFLIYFYAKNRLHLTTFIEKDSSILSIFRLETLVKFIKQSYKQLSLLITLLSAPGIVFLTHTYLVYNAFCGLDHVISSSKSYWCKQTVPHAYSYIQQHYWNVGMFRYYTINNIPNFLLAAPITVLIVYESSSVFRNMDVLQVVKTLGLQGHGDKIFVYLCHCLFTLAFGFVFVHVQILTRMLCSNSPCVYWLAANTMRGDNIVHKKLLLTYFIVFNVSGFLLHCNFYPWT